MNEVILTEAFIWQTLSSDSVLTGSDVLGGEWIYNCRAPQGRHPPFIVFNLQAGHDINNGMIRLYVEHLFQVKVIGAMLNGSLLDAPKVRAAAGRLDDLLCFEGGRSVQVENRRGYICAWRAMPLELTEQGVTPNTGYVHMGGLYRFQVMNAEVIA